MTVQGILIDFNTSSPLQQLCAVSAHGGPAERTLQLQDILHICFWACANESKH